MKQDPLPRLRENVVGPLLAMLFPACRASVHQSQCEAFVAPLILDVPTVLLSL
jgi:hypothetical protein